MKHETEFERLRREDPAFGRAWESLELAPPPAVPPGFRGAVLARVREAHAARLPALGLAPAWTRWAAAAAIAAGLGLGVVLAELDFRAGTSTAASSETAWTATTTLAEDYLDALAPPASGEAAAPATEAESR